MVELNTREEEPQLTAISLCQIRSYHGYLLEVIKILYRHRDFVLRGEEKAVSDLSRVLWVGRFSCGVVVVVLQPGLHLCLVKTGNNFVDDVLKRLVSPATNKLSWNLLKHNNLFIAVENFWMSFHELAPQPPPELHRYFNWLEFIGAVLSSHIQHYKCNRTGF